MSAANASHATGMPTYCTILENCAANRNTNARMYKTRRRLLAVFAFHINRDEGRPSGGQDAEGRAQWLGLVSIPEITFSLEFPQQPSLFPARLPLLFSPSLLSFEKLQKSATRCQLTTRVF